MTIDYDFDVSRDLSALKISFGSTMENIDRVDAETRRFVNDLGIKCDIFGISLVLREGLTNAVRHGNAFDKKKKIYYSLKLQDNSLIMDIEDQGEGFDWREVQKKNPVDDADHGRGLRIMQAYFSEYSYNEKGNKVTIIKRL